MQLKLEGVEEIGPGVWITRLNPSDVRRFGHNTPSLGSRSVVAVVSPNYDACTSTLTVRLNGLSPISVGQREDTVILDLEHSDSPNSDLSKATQTTAPEIDQDFIAACRLHLSEQTVSIIAEVLSEVRKNHGDQLVEGVGRKWTAAPRNFLAITIQNKKKQFLVSVKADPSRHAFKHIRLKRSRAPYCEFHLNSQTQVPETVQAILASTRY
jgi:hypothetical protein